MRLKVYNQVIAKFVLEYLYHRQGSWTCLWYLYFKNNYNSLNGRGEQVCDVAEAMPLEWSDRKKLALMKVLYKNGLVGGCDCGCRGDFEITDKGLLYLGRKRLKEYTGY